MAIKIISCTFFFLLPFSIYAESYYCSQNHAYISTGMTMDEVIAACGKPLSQQESNEPLMRKVPVQQLIFNNAGADTAFYGVWNIPTGSGGTQLQIDIINNKVKEIKVDGSGSNALSICEDANIQIGDDVAKVYGACGNPSVVNNTYIEEVIPTQEKPKVWIYQSDQYSTPVSLTFVNGKLQSIHQ